MSNVFRTTELYSHNGNNISVMWTRDSRKLNTCRFILPGDDGTEIIEMDYVSFEYAGIHIQYRMRADEHTLFYEVEKICRIMDDEGTDGLTSRNIEWSND